MVFSAQTNEVGFRSFFMTSCLGYRLPRDRYADHLSGREVPMAAPKWAGLTTLRAVLRMTSQRVSRKKRTTSPLKSR